MKVYTEDLFNSILIKYELLLSLSFNIKSDCEQFYQFSTVQVVVIKSKLSIPSGYISTKVN